MNINSTNSFSFCFHFSKRSSWPPILIATNERRNEAEDCSRVERERRDGSRFTFAYQRPWKDGFREKCVATLRNSSYKGETYFSPDVWKAFDLAFPSLSLSPSLLEDPPYPRDVSRCQGACIYRRERTVGDAAHPTCCSSPSNSFQASIPPRKSTPAEIYERVETLI